MAMTRKQFLRSAAALMATGVFACIGDDPAASGPPGDSTPAPDGGRSGGGDGGDTSTRDGSIGDGGIGDGSIGDGSTGDGSTGDGSTGDGGDPRCLDNGTNVAIANNHGHQMVVSKQDVASAADKTYSIQGTADHSHDVTLTAAHFAQLAQDQPVTVVSTVGSSHSHSVTVTCT